MGKTEALPSYVDQIVRQQEEIIQLRERCRVLEEALRDCICAIETLEPDILGFAYDAQSGGVAWPLQDELLYKARAALDDGTTNSHQIGS